MHDTLREKLTTEITRKQFLEYMAAAALALFGLNNFLSLFSSIKPTQTTATSDSNGLAGFGTRKFGE